MIDITKLTNVVQKGDKTVAQCPACAAAGSDNKGDHLAVFANGAYSCVANPRDKEHSKEIYKLAGVRTARDLPPSPMVDIKRQVIPASTVVFKLGRLGRKKPTSAGPAATEPPCSSAVEAAESTCAPESSESSKTTPKRQWNSSTPVSAEEAREFLKHKT